MKNVSISGNYANQELFVVADGVSYGLRLHTFRDMLYCDVTVGTTLRQRSMRCIDRTWLLPFGPNTGGNFRFEHEDRGVYPHWRELGGRCRLVYYTQSEIAAMEEA